MPTDFSTANRMYFLTLAEYGEDDLLVEEMHGHESLSELFQFNFRLLSERDDIDPRKIIGSWAKLRIETYDADSHGGERHWSGFVSRFNRTGRVASSEGHDLYTYECDLVPWLWFMTRHQDIRIFQNLSIPEIIEKVLTDAGFSDFEQKLRESHPPLVYCTQYHETNYAFIARLMERAGIYTYYKHNEAGSHDAKHILVFTDNVDSNPDVEPSQLLFHHAGMAAGADAITSLQADFSMRTGKVSVRGWDFTKKSVVQANTPTNIPIGGNDAFEHYHYPGGYVEVQLGEYFTKVLMQAEEAAFLTMAGSGQVRQLEPGYRFSLDDHPLDGLNREYLVVSVDHYGRNNLTSAAGPSDYHNRFTVQPHDVPYRSLLRTPRPRVHGPQTAIVTGPAGDEIHTDEYGRIKVQFHWDRNGKYDDKSSCWMRVAQTWAGNGYGTMFIPRVGMEVVVEFLEGDPDQPIVTGCVYNGINKPPYGLPAEATKSTIKTLSSKGGGGTNELRFEDKKGNEEIFLHAQKNLQLRTGNCKTEAVGVHSNRQVGKNQTETIGESHGLTVGKHQTVTVGLNRAQNVGADDQLTVGSDYHCDIGRNIMLRAAMNIDAKAGFNLVLEAGMILSLKAGGSSVVIGPDGVSVTGPLVRINSGGSPLQAKNPLQADMAKDAEKAIESGAGTVTNALQQAQAVALRTAALIGSAFCAECARQARAHGL